LLTTFGIFFCFAGITRGLIDFDPADVRDSVPHLLQGIRTSFWASVFGIGCALTIKLRILFFGEPPISAAEVKAGATVDDLAVQLSRLNRSIAGADDDNLLGELKLARTDSNERLDGLKGSLERFSENMVAANTKALIQALSEIIRDFNTKLDEQFGQNFKDLNSAVEKLVVWQKQYEQQLNSLIEQERTTRAYLADASVHYAELVDRASAFTPTIDSLRKLLAQANSQSERLSTSLRDLAGLVATQIEQGARVSHDTLTAVLKASAQTHNQELTDLLKVSIQAANRDPNNHIPEPPKDTKAHVVGRDRLWTKK
jgi:chromosome segregation ATPase